MSKLVRVETIETKLLRPIFVHNTKWELKLVKCKFSANTREFQLKATVSKKWIFHNLSICKHCFTSQIIDQNELRKFPLSQSMNIMWKEENQHENLFKTYCKQASLSFPLFYLYCRCDQNYLCFPFFPFCVKINFKFIFWIWSWLFILILCLSNSHANLLFTCYHNTTLCAFPSCSPRILKPWRCYEMLRRAEFSRLSRKRWNMQLFAD